MPTIGVYIPMKTARAVASRWNVKVQSGDFQDVIRNLVAEALDTEAGITHTRTPFSGNCQLAHLHRPGTRCRVCGGS